MARFLSNLFVAAILLLANFALISSATIESYDVRDLAKAEIVLNEDDIVSGIELIDGGLNRALRFIGDVEVGRRISGETVYRRQIKITNPTNQIYSTDLEFSVSYGIVHYLSLINEPGSYVVACTSEKSLGSSRSIFNIRVDPQTVYFINLFVAAH